MARVFKPECLRCRYDLTGLTESGVCPECGLSVHRSLRRDLPGTPWQRTGGIAGWWGTLVMVCRRPGELWEGMRIDKRGAEALEITSVIFAASASGALASMSVLAGAIDTDHWSEGLEAGLAALIGVELCAVLVLFAFNYLLRMAMIVWVRARGRWLSIEAAQSVLAHASGVLVIAAPGALMLGLRSAFPDRGGGCRYSPSPFVLESFAAVRWAEGAVSLSGLCLFVWALHTGARAFAESDV